jgi:hypothetical protein
MASNFTVRCRFPAPSPGLHSGKRVATIREIERQASEAWRATPCEVPAGGTEAAVAAAAVVAEPEAGEIETEERNAVAAYDFLTVQIHRQSDGQGGGGGGGGSQGASRRQAAGRNNHPAKRRRKAQAQAS